MKAKFDWKKYFPYIFLVLVLVGVGVIYLINKNSPNGLFNGNKDANSQNGTTNEAQNNKPLSDPNQILSYTHPDLGFTISYPGNYVISNLADDQGETVLLQNNGKGAQIYISDFSGNDFNSGVVRQNLSGEKLENLKDIVMPGGFTAVSFSGKDPSLGEVWDVWFVQNDKLYQITSQPGQDKLLKSLVESFKFE